MTSLVDHYLLQLKSLLPAKQRDDIAAELGESIRSSIQDKELELNRSLSDDELTELLKTYGHPLLVAGRYLPKQYLIGPGTFPIYWFSLQAVLIVVAVVAGIVCGVALLTHPRPLQAAIQVILDFGWIALGGAAVVTLVFAFIDDYSGRLRFFENFDPRERGAGIWGVRAAPLAPIARQDTVFELAFIIVFSLWWAGGLNFRNVMPAGIAIELTSAVDPFYWPVLALCAAELTRLGVDFVRPYRTRPRVLVRLVLNIAWLVLFTLAFRTEELLQGTLATVDGVDVASTVAMAERVLRIVVFVLGTVTAGLIATDVVRLLRR